MNKPALPPAVESAYDPQYATYLGTVHLTEDTTFGETLYAFQAKYLNGGIAIELLCDDGEPYTTLSCYIAPPSRGASPLGPKEFFCNTWSENEHVREPALASGLFRDTGKRVATGFVQAEVWEVIV